MTIKATKLLRDAMKLPAADRADIASCLYGSLDEETLAYLDKNWDKEIRRRLKEIDQGKAKLIPWRKAKKQIFGDA